MHHLPKTKIKICGIKNIKTIDCCIENKVDFFGLIFYKKSPRNIPIEKAKKLLDYTLNKNILSVGVFVNETAEYLSHILNTLNFNYVQLHGKETNEYIKKIKLKNNIKIIKVISVKNSKDIENTKLYKDADMFLFDYKPESDELPGGNAKKFNWKLIKDISIDKDWFISGGINIDNINDIKQYTIPYGIDISSGVEDNPGLKSNEKIIKLINKYESK
jgi:phosphoribosylanthranilate isomerase